MWEVGGGTVWEVGGGTVWEVGGGTVCGKNQQKTKIPSLVDML